MFDPKKQNLYFLFLFLAILVAVAAKLAGPGIFDNNWSFIYWQLLPSWWSITIVAVAALLILIVWRIPSALTTLIKPWLTPICLLLLLLAAIIARFDSFLYGSGNLTVAKIAQADVLIARPYEFGLVHLASWLFHFINPMMNNANMAGALAWQLLGWLSAACTLWWGWQLSLLISRNIASQLCISAALFFGPHAAVFFGLVAPEPVVVAATVGVARYLTEIGIGNSRSALLKLWLLQLLAAFLYLPVLFLLPTTLCATLLCVQKKRSAAKPAVIVSSLIALAMLAGLYVMASNNLELASALLFFAGKNPNSDYGVFSFRHLGDMLQLLLLVSPQIVALIYLLVKREPTPLLQRLFLPLLLLLLSGIAMALIREPNNSIVLDFPLLIAYLAPIQILALLLLVNPEQPAEHEAGRVAGYLIVSLFALASWFPVQRSIVRSQEFVRPYLERHNNFYRAAIYAFRDAFFAQGNFDLANEWEAKLLARSPEYLDLQGCRDLSLHDRDTEALNELYKLKTNFPYWGDPRYVLAGIQNKLGRPQFAKPELDTALMLEPYNKSYLIAQYSLERDRGALTIALDQVKQTLRYFPFDSLILADYMAIAFRSGDIRLADSLRKDLTGRFPGLPYPYAIEGMIAEKLGNLQAAETAYENFMSRAKEGDPDKPMIRKRLNEVILKIRGEE